ncbi:MAG: hypothetical protein NC229_08525 [Bacteroides sp.]|nr:hypothetical protein [Bacteroidales bacterium]MCM1068711.1 hypothetical protein [Prevotella sp.]MCM1354689.1 hypothetical protein [Bacteroides sp.]MCM1403763.1 hypothetical protein [Bacteroides sp.]MCM1443519.1 hypothetical protein [Muribaculum sp.]
MELIHKLIYNNEITIIDEPIGFDNLQMSMQRNDYHGIGAEVSEGNLEFYGEAMSIIYYAYLNNIDNDVLYQVYAGEIIIYSGSIDLSTCKFKQADYTSVSVKVGEIGVKTTFNNRLDTEVDLNTSKTIDGANMNMPKWLSLHIPQKHLLYTNYLKQSSDNSVKLDNGQAPALVDQNCYQFLSLFPDTTIANEYGTIGDMVRIKGSTWKNEGTQNKPVIRFNIQLDDDLDMSEWYEVDADFEDKYGENTTHKIDINISLTLKFNGNIFISPEEAIKATGLPPIGDPILNCRLVLIEGNQLYSGDESTIKASSEKVAISNGDLDTHSLALKATIDDISTSKKLFVGLLFSHTYIVQVYIPELAYWNQWSGNLAAMFNITLQEGSYFKTTMYDKLIEANPIKTDMLLIHDALNIISHAISENDLAVRSEWYRTPHSRYESGDTGGGALKALTNGYKIRGLFTDSENTRNMPLSFKTMIESLNALDCIGWGFSKEEDGVVLRVERWEWFYKSSVILEFDNVLDLLIIVDTERIPTTLKIGYKKYATNEQYNSIESPHGMRTFTNDIKSVCKEVAQTCEFIADNYAIEEIRRARTQLNNTEESSYDENIFVFELVRKRRDITTQTDASFEITGTSLNATDVGRREEFINAKLTPRHMAARWADYIFTTNNTSSFRFIAGEINYKAIFSCIPTLGIENRHVIESLQSFAATSPQGEDDDINYRHSIFRAEKIQFSYPISIEQYTKIKDNPYGIIRVNEKYGWILEFKYSFVDGMADFVLLSR